MSERSRSPRARIAWYGDFCGEGSLQRVNRHLARAVFALGDIDVVPCGEPTPHAEAAVGISPRRREDVPDDAPLVVLRHRWPPHFMAPRARYVHVQPWEFGVVPRLWAERVTARADDAWCYTEYVRDAYLAAGVPSDLVHVVPLGFDPAVYHPGVEPLATSDPTVCIFLFVGGMTPRKNLGLVINAYLTAFTATDPVALLIKDNPASGFYDAGLSQAHQRRLAGLGAIPVVRFLESEYRDADMARLYRAASALVHPYRGEGFGLPVLEAMACGTPVIVSGGGATDDFVDERAGYVIPAERTPIGTLVDGMELGREGWWLTPSADALVAAFRDVYERRGEARTRGATAAARAASAWTWHHAALHVRGRLDALVGTPQRPKADDADDLNAYEGRISTPHGEDGMLIELLGRLRAPEPFFVALGARDGRGGVTTIFGRRLGWSGLTIEENPAVVAELQAGDAPFPALRTVPAPVCAETVVELCRAHGVPALLDLLAVGSAGDGAAWDALCAAGFRPRVVVAAGKDVLALGERLGYALLAVESRGVNAVFVRRDLVSSTGFPARPFGR